MQIAENQAVYELVSGVRLVVTPLTVLLQRVLRHKAFTMYPYPDPEPYIKPIQDSFEPGAMTRAEDNSEYMALCADVDKLRESAFWNLIIDTCVDYAGGSRDVLIEQNRRLIDAVRAAVIGQPIAQSLLNDWVILIMSCLATGETEVQEILAIAQRMTPLSSADVSEGFRLFRYVAVQRNDVSNTRRE